MKRFVPGLVGVASGLVSTLLSPVVFFTPLFGTNSLLVWLIGLCFALASFLIPKFRHLARRGLWLLACTVGFGLAFHTFSLGLDVAHYLGVIPALTFWLALPIAGVVGAVLPTLVLRVHSPLLRGGGFWLTLLLSGMLSLPGVLAFPDSLGVPGFPGALGVPDVTGFMNFIYAPYLLVLPLFVVWQAGMLMWYTSRLPKRFTEESA